MKNIQLISLNRTNYTNITCSTFKTVEAPDSFYINVIDLSNEQIWRSRYNAARAVNIEEDLNDLRDLINNSTKTTFVIILPKNLNYCYSLNTMMGRENYMRSLELKKRLDIIENVLGVLGISEYRQSIGYEKNSTKINGKSYICDFYLKHFNGSEAVVKAIDTEKCLVGRFGRFVLSTIQLENEQELLDFLTFTNIISSENEQNAPHWIKEIEFFDDKSLKEKINSNSKRIEELNEEIEKANLNLKANNKYKQLLYETGDALVNIVFDVLEEMINVELKNFIDEKKEDFVFNDSKYTYIGEIKGVNSNVKNSHISQLVHHYDYYTEAHEDLSENARNNIKKLLIINHQRSIKPSDRIEINEEQIDYAQKNNILIIETTVLIKIVENFKKNIITKEDVLNLFSSRIGRLSI